MLSRQFGSRLIFFLQQQSSNGRGKWGTHLVIPYEVGEGKKAWRATSTWSRGFCLQTGAQMYDLPVYLKHCIYMYRDR